MFLAGFLAMTFDSGSYDGETVADAAKKLSGRNFVALLGKGARLRRQGTWEAVRQVMADFQAYRADEIGPDTLLLKKR